MEEVKLKVRKVAAEPEEKKHVPSHTPSSLISPKTA